MQCHIKHSLGLFLALIVLVVPPALAQQDTRKRIAFEDFGFNLDAALATNLNVVQFPGDPNDEVYPGGPQPPHTQFLLYVESPAPEFALQARATITVYSLDAMNGYEAHRRAAETLHDLLTERPDLSEFEQTRDSLSEITLPFLPLWSGAQAVRARAAYVETDALNGISYVTVYRQDVAPFLDYEFIYTFQGLSTDGTKYISMLMPVRARMFPDALPTDYDFEAFVPGMTEYFAESIALLNSGSINDYEPTLSSGLDVVESITIGN